MTESDDLYKKLHEFNEDFPDTPMNEESRKFLKENPLDFVVSRTRSLRAALRTGDQDRVDLLVDDVAHVMGKRNAQFWMITIMGKMVEDEMNEESGISKDDEFSNLE